MRISDWSSDVCSSETIVSRNAQSSESARDEMRQLAAALSETASAASSAWSEYRARFEDVDRALGDAIEKISAAAGNHASNLYARVGQIAKDLGDGVGPPGGARQPPPPQGQT